MKKKHRDIVVDGKNYAWTVSDTDDGNCLVIWFNRKPVYDVLIGGHIDITPKLISQLIKADFPAKDRYGYIDEFIDQLNEEK
jgi:hypothetical protein